MGRCAHDTRSSLALMPSVQVMNGACTKPSVHGRCKLHTCMRPCTCAGHMALMALSTAGGDMQDTQYVCLWHCGTQAQGWLPCSSRMQLQVGLSGLLALSKATAGNGERQEQGRGLGDCIFSLPMHLHMVLLLQSLWPCVTLGSWGETGISPPGQRRAQGCSLSHSDSTEFWRDGR